MQTFLRTACRETSWPQWRRAYGYAPGEAAVIAEVFERFAGGETMKAIVSDLNRREIPSPGANWKREGRAHHGRWLVSAPHSIIKNERYAGRPVYTAASGTRIRTRVDPPLVDPDRWQHAQLRFTSCSQSWTICSRPTLSPKRCTRCDRRRGRAHLALPTDRSTGKHGARGAVVCGYCGAGIG